MSRPTVPPFSDITPAGNGATDHIITPDPIPDYTVTKGDKPVGTLPPPAAKKTPGKPTGLGTNRPAKTARKLTEEDRQKLIGYYSSVGFTVSMFRPLTGEVIVANAESCTDAWFKLADENASVRRAILAMMEGSAWAGILAAHLPILMVALPKTITERNPILGPIQDMVIAQSLGDQKGAPEQ